MVAEIVVLPVVVFVAEKKTEAPRKEASEQGRESLAWQETSEQGRESYYYSQVSSYRLRSRFVPLKQDIFYCSISLIS